MVVNIDFMSLDMELEDPLSERHLDEVYYLWRLAGGELEAILKKAGLIKTKPPIMSLAK